MHSHLRLLLALTLVGLAATACSGAPRRATTADEIFATKATVTSSVTPGTLVFVVLHVRPPARLLEDLPAGSSAVLVPEHLRLEHPHSEQIEKNGVLVLEDFNPKDVDQFDPAPPPPPRQPNEPPEPAPENVYATLTNEPQAFIATGEIAIGWAGVASRVWVRACSHKKPGRVDLFVEDDVLDRPVGKERFPVCLETAWFPGVDTVYRGADQRTIVTGDPGRQGVPVVVVRAAN